MDRPTFKLRARAAKFDLASAALKAAEETAVRANNQAREGLDLVSAAVENQKEVQALNDAAARQNAVTALHIASAAQEAAKIVRELAENGPQPQPQRTNGYDVVLELVRAGRGIGEELAKAGGGKALMDKIGDKVAGLLQAVAAGPQAGDPQTGDPPQAQPAQPAPDAPPDPEDARRARVARMLAKLPDDVLGDLEVALIERPVSPPPPPPQTGTPPSSMFESLPPSQKETP